jgi:hypothetical protein
LLLPDIYILEQGQPARAVAVLMCMHVAIGLVTYNALVRLAPVLTRRRRNTIEAPRPSDATPCDAYSAHPDTSSN